MARARTLSPGFFTNEELLTLTPVHRLFFLGLLTEADRLGRLEDRPTRLRARILPAEVLDADVLLSDLDRTGLISRYEVNGERYILIPKFLKHQHPHPNEKASVIHAPRVRKTSTKGMKDVRPRSDVGHTKEVSTLAGSSGSSCTSGSSGSLKPSGSSEPSGSSGSSARASGGVARAGIGAGVMAGTLPRDHLQCRPPCERMCLSEKQHAILRGRYGGEEAAADAALDAFYREVRLGLDPGVPIGDRPWEFWDKQFAAKFGTTTALGRTAGNRAAAERFIARGQP